MLAISQIKRDKNRVLSGLRIRNWAENDLKIVDEVLQTDDARRAAQSELDATLAESKQLSQVIGGLYREGRKEDAEAMKVKVSQLKERSRALQEEMDRAAAKLEDLLLQLPNIPHDSVPKGQKDKDNELYKDWTGALPELGPEALPHWELAGKYRIFDLDLGTKITGSGFPVYRGQGAKLERALINFFLDEAHRAGYEEIIPPLLVNADTAKGTGQLPDKEGQMYYIEKDGFYLIPTAEVPLTNIYRDQILSAEDFPIKLAGYTPCFRREAGSYGADVRGLNRVHQFDKVEIVQIVHPDQSYQILDEMVAHVEVLLEKLELPYRIMRLCGGDLGFTSALTYDFEVYSAAQKKWLEVSSVSNFESFQTNRMKIRFKDGKKMRLAHTLNGSALALARIVASLLENNQTSEGIVVPAVLRGYTNFEKIH